MKKFLFFLLTILIPVIFLISYMKDDIDTIQPLPDKGPSRPMVELTDAELNQVFGQAGIQYINDHFNFQFTVDEVTTVSEFQNQLLNYMNHLQETNPEQAMNTYVDMINTVNTPLNPNIIPGPNVTHIQIDLQHVMENVIIQGVNFMSSASSQTGIGTFGIQGLEVHAEGTFHLFIRND